MKVSNPAAACLPRQPHVAIEAVRKVYGHGANSLTALEDVTFDFRKGELVVLLGPSGCGKTTLLQIVSGLVGATSGAVRVDGRVVTQPGDDFGFVFQAPTLLPWRTSLSNILFPMEVKGRIGNQVRDRARELLELVELSAFADKRPHELSGGMRQRVALCRALVQEPSLLLMDEPFGALDELTRMDMHDLLHRMRAISHASALFVTHSIMEAVYLADHILVFSKRPGRVIDHIRVDLPYPRTPEIRFTKEFADIAKRAGAGLGVLHV